jgi:hypothetical protein
MCTIAIIINSCFKFYNTTIEPIIKSAENAKIPSENIYVVVGESDEETDIIYNGRYNIIFCKYVNEAYNSAIYFTQTQRGIQEINKYTHFFYTQDTTDFLDCFWEKINKYALVCDSYIKLEHICSKNIGFFNVKWFLENKTDLLSYYVNYDKNLILKYKSAEFPNKELIYGKFNNLAQWLNEDCLFMFDGNGGTPLGKTFENNVTRYMINKYNNGDRLANVYNEPGIIKYQKNWGQSSDWDITL